MSSTKRHRSWSIVSLVFSALIVICAVWIFANRHYVADALTVWSYQPSTAVAAIENRATMTDQGGFFFYATRPSVLEAAEFNQNCPRQEVGNPILGCYTGEDRIYIYDVTDTNLDGIKEVTAVHEMLHAAWRRTDAAEQSRIGDLLQRAYASLDDAKLKTRMDYYQRTEPGQFVNELHSILGTEVTNLGSELEAYYTRYFDRAQVLALHQGYNGFYNTLTDQANALYKKMTVLGAKISGQSASYEQDARQLSKDIATFNKRASSGQFSSQAAFNNERAILVQRTNTLDAMRDAVNLDIEKYNDYYNQYQKLTGQLQLLNQSMDSYNTLKAAPSV